tara:strand:- start:522 stop:653 length:132 start_codon:yes stop_codon:yes gene_type:complete
VSCVDGQKEKIKSESEKERERGERGAWQREEKRETTDLELLVL